MSEPQAVLCKPKSRVPIKGRDKHEESCADPRCRGCAPGTWDYPPSQFVEETTSDAKLADACKRCTLRVQEMAREMRTRDVEHFARQIEALQAYFALQMLEHANGIRERRGLKPYDDPSKLPLLHEDYGAYAAAKGVVVNALRKVSW